MAELSAEAFERLLELLDPDPVTAGRRYGELRARLVRLFEWRGARDPEELADETFFRVARRLGDGVEIRADDPYNYFCGVAFLVFKESLRERKREQALEDPRNWPVADDDEPVEDERMEALQACLGELPAEGRELLLDYQRGEKRERIDNRRRIAERLGVPLNALRIRVHRLRAKLEACVRRRLFQEDART